VKISSSKKGGLIVPPEVLLYGDLEIGGSTGSSAPDGLNLLQEKAVEATKQEEEIKRKKLKPEEQEGMPQHQHYGWINLFFFVFFFAPPGYGTGQEPAPTPSTGGV
jgi:hypothetical protein